MAIMSRLAARAIPPARLARAIRISAGASQAEVARELGVHRTTVARWESGSRHPRAGTAAAYLALLRELEGSLR